MAAKSPPVMPLAMPGTHSGYLKRTSHALESFGVLTQSPIFTCAKTPYAGRNARQAIRLADDTRSKLQGG